MHSTTVSYNRIDYSCDLDENNVPYNLRPLKNYITYYDLLNNVDLTNSVPCEFIIKKDNIIIADSYTTIPTWISIVKAIWNSMELKRIIYNTSYDLIVKESIDEHDCVYNRGNISLPFTMKNNNDAFKKEIMHLVNINEYKIDITIKWIEEDGDNGRRVYYKNF